MNGIPLQVNPIQLNPTQGGPISNAGGAPVAPVAPMGAMGNQPSGVAPAPATPTGGFNVQNFYNVAKQQGVSDNEIQGFLQDKGVIPPADNGFMSNLGNSAVNFAKGIGNIFAHPIDTTKNLANIGLGLAETPIALATGQQINNPTYEAFINNMAERYGGIENIKHTAYTDPVGFLADIASVVDGGGTALTKLGEVSKLGTVARAGEILSKVGEAANPINIAAKPFELASTWAKAGLADLGTKLETSNLRLTPVQKANFASKIPEVADYISKEIPLGGPETRFEASVAKVDGFEEKLQNFLDTDAKGITVPKKDLQDVVNGLKEQFRTDRDSLAIDRQLDEFQKLLESKFPDEIPLADLNKLKRSTFKNAFNQTGTKVSDAVEYMLGDVMKTGIENATGGFKDYSGKTFPNIKIDGKTIGEFNKEYGVALNAKKLLKIAMGRPQANFIEHLVSSSFGGAVGSAFGPLGAGVGTLAGEAAAKSVPMTAIKSAAGKTGRAASNIIPKVKIPKGVASAATAAAQVNVKVKKPKD